MHSNIHDVFGISNAYVLSEMTIPALDYATSILRKYFEFFQALFVLEMMDEV